MSYLLRTIEQGNAERGNTPQALTTITPGASSPTDTYAAITRAQFADVERRFFPLEDLANDAVLDVNRRNELRKEAEGFATDSARQAFDAADDRRETLRSRFGVAPTARVANDEQHRGLLRRRGAEIDAANNARDYVRDRELELAAGSGS